MKDPSIRRSLALFRAFRHEQEDPEACYSLLARDAADQVEAYGGPVKARTVVDVGGGAATSPRSSGGAGPAPTSSSRT